MDKNSTNKITHKFLTNQPSGEDLFENKSQDKIAKVISEKIINEPEFKIIGIDGEWGSGKSNLVRLVEKSLKVLINSLFMMFGDIKKTSNEKQF